MDAAFLTARAYAPISIRKCFLKSKQNQKIRIFCMMQDVHVCEVHGKFREV